MRTNVDKRMMAATIVNVLVLERKGLERTNGRALAIAYREGDSTEQ